MASVLFSLVWSKSKGSYKTFHAQRRWKMLTETKVVCARLSTVLVCGKSLAASCVALAQFWVATPTAAAQQPEQDRLVLAVVGPRRELRGPDLHPRLPAVLPFHPPRPQLMHPLTCGSTACYDTPLGYPRRAPLGATLLAHPYDTDTSREHSLCRPEDKDERQERDHASSQQEVPLARELRDKSCEANR